MRRRPSTAHLPKIALLTLLALSVGTRSAHALSFDLGQFSYQEDGFTREQTFFPNDDQTRIYISLPRTWTVTAGGSTLALGNPAVPNCAIRLEKSSFTPDVAFKDKGLDGYRSRALAQVPNGSVGVQVSQEQADPLPIFGWHDYEFFIDYEFYGQTFRRSVLFLDLNPKEQLVLSTVSLKADFDRTHEVALDVLRSWQVMPLH